MEKMEKLAFGLDRPGLVSIVYGVICRLDFIPLIFFKYLILFSFAQI